MRLLAPVRLSRLTDATTSVDTQRGEIERYATAHGHVIVAATQDLDVSGGEPIRDRPGIGPWLADGRLGDWDGIIGYKFDRLFRNHYDFVTFYHDYCEGYGKVIISVGEGIDTSTQMGRFIAGILVQFAEWELARMKERRGDAKRRLISQAYWNGGQAPFGYAPVRTGDHFELIPHPVNAEVVREMATWIISGKSANSLAKELNSREIPTGQGKIWRTANLVPFLRSPRLRGYVLEGNRKAAVMVLGPDGMPVRRTPVIDDQTWAALQAVLDRNADRRSAAVHVRASALLGVAFCALCDRKLYADVRNVTPTHAYYICPGRREEGCTARSIRMNGLEALASCLFLAMVGNVEIFETIKVPGDDHSVKLAEVGQAIAELVSERFVRGVLRDGYDRMLADLQAEYGRLAALAPEPDRAEERATGQTFADRWQASDMRERRQLMIGAGFQVHIARTEIAGPVATRAERKRMTSGLELNLASLLAEVGVTNVPTATWDEMRKLVRPTVNLVLAWQLDPDLTRRAGLAASGQPVGVREADPEVWQRVLAPVREHVGKSPLTFVDAPGQADAAAR